MKRFELYSIRTLLIVFLAALAASPLLAATHFLHGIAGGKLDITHLLSLGYLLLIALAMVLISPVFGDNKPRRERQRAGM